MTDCNAEPLHFSTLGSKAVVADFQGAGLPPTPGAFLLREVADKIGLFDALNDAIPDPRNPAFILHDQRAMIAQRVTAIALGMRTSTIIRASADPVLQLAGQTAPSGSDPRLRHRLLCRLENRVERKALVEVAEVFVDQFSSRTRRRRNT